METNQKDLSSAAEALIKEKSMAVLLREDPISEESFSLLQYLFDADEGGKIKVWGPILEGKLVEKDGWLQRVIKITFEQSSVQITLQRVVDPRNIVPAIRDVARKMLGTSAEKQES